MKLKKLNMEKGDKFMLAVCLPALCSHPMVDLSAALASQS